MKKLETILLGEGFIIYFLFVWENGITTMRAFEKGRQCQQSTNVKRMQDLCNSCRLTEYRIQGFLQVRGARVKLHA